MPVALADLALHKPIRLSRRGSGASDSIIWSGVASAADLLEGYAVRMADGSIGSRAEVTPQARIDTARGLRGVPVVSPEDHQRWAAAHQRGERYTETALGTVIDSDLDPTDPNRAIFSMSIHDPDANRRIALPENDPDALPMVSVAYEPDLGEPSDPRADFAQLGRRVRHLALVPRGRDPHAHIVRGFADGASMLTLAELKAKHPDVYKRARASLRISRRAGVAFADAISLDKAIPLIKEMMADDVGALVLHALVNAPAEMAEIEKGVEEGMDADPANPIENVAKKDMTAMADALNARIAALDARVSTVDAKVKPLLDRHAAADAESQANALKRRADKIAQALDAQAIARPAGFDPANPTPAMCDAAQDALTDAMIKPRPTLGAPLTKGPRWNGDGTKMGADTTTDDPRHAL